MSSSYLLIILGIAIVYIIVACAKLKWHPLLVLLSAALLVGIFSGMSAKQTMETILSGSGAIFAGIGFLIILGNFLGEVLEKTGAAASIARQLVNHSKQSSVPHLTHALGILVGIPVFCDAGFILLSRLIQSMNSVQGSSVASLQLSLGTGLYASHVLIPPTPGPMAATGNLGLENQLGWVILLGLLLLLPVGFITSMLIRKMDKQLFSSPLEPIQEAATSTPENNPQHSLFSALLPLLLPLFLITTGSVAPFFIGTEQIRNGFQFLGHPVIALGISALLALLLLARRESSQWGAWFQQALIQSGPIIFITAAGGAFGAVLKATPLQEILSGYLQTSGIPNWAIYPVAFLLAAVLKTAQGSSTAALIITSALLFPVMGSFDLNTPQQALVVLAIGSGAMTVSHANDSYFWVIHQYGKIPVPALYRSYTLLTAAMGISTLLGVLALYVLTG